MDLEEYRIQGKIMVDYIANYLGNIRKRRVFPDVKPGYMRSLLPESAPEDGESFHDIFEDVEKVIMPGVKFYSSGVLSLKIDNYGRKSLMVLGHGVARISRIKSPSPIKDQQYRGPDAR
ncbi:histidine decarboxylase [Trichonephila clavipes]|nr:histidine decarboxylase [Trichonephila clavipes]